MDKTLRLQGFTIDELYNVPSIDIHTKDSNEPVPILIACSKCSRNVHASRYAFHLEKCMNTSQRKSLNQNINS